MYNCCQQTAPIKIKNGIVQGSFEDGLTLQRHFLRWPAEFLKILDAYFKWRRSQEGEKWAK